MARKSAAAKKRARQRKKAKYSMSKPPTSNFSSEKAIGFVLAWIPVSQESETSLEGL